MTKSEISRFRRDLNIKQTELTTGIRNREALAIEASPDELDRIQHATERDHAMSSLERNSSRLREVRSALSRIEAGTFGICTSCEDAIHPKRLAAVPWAPSCIACQESEDHKTTVRDEEFELSLQSA